MPAYILRFAGTNSLAGFYSANSENALFDLLDEDTEPGDYEYAVIPDGFGIEFRKGKGWLDVTIGEEADFEVLLAKANRVCLTSDLSSALADDDALEWRRLDMPPWAKA